MSECVEISTPEKEGPFLTSKFLKLPILFDREELIFLCEELQKNFSSFYLFPVSGFVQKGEEMISVKLFIDKYGKYLTTLKSGKIPDISLYRNIFSSILTVCKKSVYAIDVKEGRYLIKPRRPVIQIQPHHFIYSKENETFHSMAYSKKSISWGLLFSYPQIYQNPKTHQISSVMKDEGFANTSLFKFLQKWVRHNTQPTPFLVGGKKINQPMRIGRSCLSWINNHPQLKDISVED